MTYGCLFVCNCFQVVLLFQVKTDVFAVTDVPVRHQQWTGWPDAARDETVSLMR